MLARLAECRSEIEAAGVTPTLIHMMPDEEAERLFAKYELADLPRVSDPRQKLHQALELRRGSALEVMGPKVWWAGFKSVILGGHWPGKPSGDVFQLGGAFLIEEGQVVAGHRSQTTYDQPDFIAIIKGEQSV